LPYGNGERLGRGVVGGKIPEGYKEGAAKSLL